MNVRFLVVSISYIYGEDMEWRMKDGVNRILCKTTIKNVQVSVNWGQFTKVVEL